MGELIAPKNGDVMVNCFLPSGSILELQLYFKKGEDAFTVLLRELTKEGLSHSLVPQIVAGLRDIFLAERRSTPISERIGRRVNSLLARKPERWYEYTQQLPAFLPQLRSLQSEANILMSLLSADRARFYENLQGGTSYEAHKATEKAEKEFREREQAVIDSFWARLGQDNIDVSAAQSAVRREAKSEFQRRIVVSVGTLRKRKVELSVILTEDMFLERVEEGGIEGEEVAGLEHPENVYTVNMTALCLPVTVQDGVLSVLPDLIRKCEDSAEVHFPSVRQQVEKLNALGKSNSQAIGFTRHSNIGLARGAFHLVSMDMVRTLIPYCDRSSVSCLIFPLCEWLEDVSVREDTDKFLSFLKQGLTDCSDGDMRQVVLTLDTDQRDCRTVTEALYTLFSEELLPEAC